MASLLALVSVAIGFSSAAGLALPLAMVFGLFVGLCGGLLNGLIIAGLNLHPLVVTLGTMAFFRGLAYAVTNANATPWLLPTSILNLRARSWPSRSRCRQSISARHSRRFRMEWPVCS